VRPPLSRAWCLALALLVTAVAPIANANEVVRTAVSGGAVAGSDGVVVLRGTVAEAGVVGLASGADIDLVEGFWFPPLAILDAGGPGGPDGPRVPLVAEVRHPSPNPLRGATAIPYAVASPGPVRMRVFDVGGRVVRSLVDRDHAAGWYTATWDGRDAGGRPVGSGVYHVATRIGTWQTTTKLIVTR